LSATGIQLVEWIHTIVGLAVLSRVIPRVVSTITNVAVNLLPRTRRWHSRELRNRITYMPFIYKDILLEVDKDYVQTRMRPAALADIADRERNRAPDYAGRSVWNDELENFELGGAYKMIWDHPLAIILGNAGIGKSTFALKCIVSLASGRDFTSGLYSSGRTEDLIPFFVPLKVLSITQQCPVIDYLTHAYRYIGGRRGRQKLLALAEKKKLLIVLDGYDEVYVSSLGRSPIISDINRIFSMSVPDYLDGSADSVTKDLYRWLGRNRIWLTSRNEFYDQNRLAIEGTAGVLERNREWVRDYYRLDSSRGAWPDPRLVDARVASVEITGIVDRKSLVRKIFDRYKAKSERFRSTLHENSFLRYIDNQLDTETAMLSESPLFLTAMCYLYIQRQDYLGEHAPPDRMNVRDLITECTRLLVSDIDEFKVRGLENTAILRRYQYSDEKTQFLRYFAALLYSDRELSRKSVFTESDAYAAAESFFEGEADQRRILLELRKRTPGSIVNQLILQGVFVVVDSSYGEKKYDFPHRRFREVLAVQYMDNPRNIGKLVRDLAEPHLREFILVFFSLTQRYQDYMLREILSRYDNTHHDKYFLDLAADCIEVMPPDYSPNSVIEPWIKNLVENEEITRIAGRMARRLTISPELRTWLVIELNDAILRDDVHSTSIVGGLLCQLDREAFQGVIVKILDDRSVLSSSDMELLKTTVELDSETTRAVLLNGVQGNNYEVFCRLVTDQKYAVHDLSWWTEILELLKGYRHRKVLSAARQVHPSLYKAIRQWAWNRGRMMGELTKHRRVTRNLTARIGRLETGTSPGIQIEKRRLERGSAHW